MTRLLGVNIDHVATLRQARRTPYPDLIEAAEAALRGGADQITVHLRCDRRHIQDGDVAALAAWGKLPLNLEMAIHPDIVALACRIKPARVTLVPERRAELTTEGGLNAAALYDSLRKPITALRAQGIGVSLFIEPEQHQLAAAKELGVSDIELHTGAYATATVEAREAELAKLHIAAQQANGFGLRTCAGHGLHVGNLKPLLAIFPRIIEFNIGHAIVARAIFIGLEGAVRELKQILKDEREESL